MRWLWPRMQRVSPVVAAPWGASSFATISASKKSLYAAEQQRADVARARRRWIREQGLLDPARLVFIDETATSTNMVRLRGRCARGTRLIGYAPHGHWKTITFVAGLRHDRMVAPFVLEGPMKWANLCRIRQTVFGSNAQAPRYGHYGQSSIAQGARRARSD